MDAARSVGADFASDPPPPPPPPPPSAITTTPVDGGPDYYSQFTHPLAASGDSNYFPIGTWSQYDFTQAHLNQDKAVGFNTLVGNGGCCPTAGEQANLDASGMRVLNGNDYASTAANSTSHRGWVLDDEVDGRFGLPQGFTVMQQDNAATPNDGRMRYANYTKNVLIWYSDADAARFVNEFQQVVSSDFYWFTDPYQVPTMEAPDWFPEAGQTISTPQIRRAANYGYQVDRMRQLDALDGKRQPIWAVVEEGWPFTQTAAEGARAITPPEMRAAVWQSLIAGARGVIYFGYSFGGSCPTQYIDRDTSGCYTAIQQMLTSVNAQITQLAPVLNSPTITSGISSSGGVRSMGKLTSSGQVYIFAGATTGASSATFTVPNGSIATVVGENRSIPITGGTFTDSFADKNAVHIYKVS